MMIAGLQIPVMPSFEVRGRAGAAAPAQSDVFTVKVGVMLEPTDTITLVVKAHCPAVGVKVYVPVAVLLTVAGLQVPVIPSFEVRGRTGAAAPVQIAVITEKVGVTTGLTVTVRGTVVAHWPAVGVKVYVAVTVLLTVDGLQAPVIPSFDAKGRIGEIAPAQIARITEKVGVTTGLTVTVQTWVVAHWPAVGVKV